MYILTIHGLGGSSATFWPIQKYLEFYYTPPNGERLIVDAFGYKSKSDEFPAVIEKLHKKLDSLEYETDTERVCLIGHSLGGIVASHVQHPRVDRIITISSPLTDCKLARMVEERIPAAASDFLFGKMYEALILPPLVKQPDTVKIVSITSCWMNTTFDGRVFTDEMVHPQAMKTLHLGYSGHLSQLLDPRMMRLVYDALVAAEL